jgi:hypothetical protein
MNFPREAQVPLEDICGNLLQHFILSSEIGNQLLEIGIQYFSKATWFENGMGYGKNIIFLVS